MRGILIALSLSICLSFTNIIVAAPGLLVVHPANPRYFMVQGDPDQKVVYLTGSHTWAEFQTYLSESFNFTDWVSQLVGWNHNFMRGWTWEDDYYTPMPFNTSGSDYDLDSYNTSFFNHYKDRIQEAANSDLYISIMLFQGWSVTAKGGLRSPDPWPHHPYKSSNNVNGINGDPNGNGEGLECHTWGYTSIRTKQEAYVRHFIDELNSYDNIIWEIGNEFHSGSVQWQDYMVDYIKSYEACKPKQHLVWMNGDAGDLFASSCHADVVSPGGSNYRTNPPVSKGQKIVISDSDHQGPLSVTHPWAWRNFTRGNMPILMDCKYQGLTWWTGGGFDPNNAKWQRMRNALGITKTYADKMELASVAPQDGGTSPASTGYCLYETGKQYMIYQPTSGGSITIYNLPGGQYDYEWIHPHDRTYSPSLVSFSWSSGNKNFGSAPFSGDSALYVYKSGYPVAVIDADPTKGLPPFTVNFDGLNSYDPDGTITTYEWDFENDGTVDATGPTTSHEYTDYIDYTASLKVTDDSGLTDTTTVIISGVHPLGDFNGDDDVDQEDFGHLQECMSGNGVDQNDPNCQDAKLDDDDDVDVTDAGLFIGCMSGANVIQSDPGCMP